MSLTKAEAYEVLPEVYDKLMAEINYRSWAKYIVKITGRYRKAGGIKVLELGGGNGKLANELRRFFGDITTSDLSFNMLAYNDYRVKKVCCDMTKTPFKGEYDLIICSFDTVNYLTTQKKLNDFFKEMGRLLSPKGVFTFDAALEENSLRYVKVPERKGKTKNYNFIQQTAYNIKTKIHSNKFIVKDKSGNTYTEIHKQKIYPMETYFKLIMQNGMFVAECFEGFTLDEPGKDALRLQFLVKKQ